MHETGRGDRIVHPFFVRPNGVAREEIPNTSSDASLSKAVAPNEADSQEDGAANREAKGSRRPRKLKDAAQSSGKQKVQKTLQDLVNPPSQAPAASTNGSKQGIVDPSASEPGPDSVRRKRRRTSHIEAVDVGTERQAGSVGNETMSRAATTARQPSPQVVIPRLPQRLSVSIGSMDEQQPFVERRTPPKKLLRLNKSGKFSSPVTGTARTENRQGPSDAPKRRGRSRKSKDAAQDSHFVVCLKYGQGGNDARRAQVGVKIENILSGTHTVSLSTVATPRKQRTPCKLARSTHPFFLGKPKDGPAPKQESQRKLAAITLGKLKTQTSHDRIRDFRGVDRVYESALFKDRLMVKHPSAKEPAWPDREQMHVHNLDISEHLPTSDAAPAKRRKRKHARLPIPPEESLIHRFSINLQPESETKIDQDAFNEPPESLRVPQRLLLSGLELRKRVESELCASLHLAEHGPLEELLEPEGRRVRVHTALQKLYDSIPDHFTAYDGSRGEMLSWTQKYAPSTGDEVLQPAREMEVLKKWLHSLTVNAVDASMVNGAKPAVRPEPKPKKKHRRRADDLEDFLVDSDEEIHDMDQLTDPEDLASLKGRKAQASVIQTAHDGVKLSNAVLISGPTGCGKTAAAYAVAKELGFKVFEISPSEPRSGREVVDRVGDMSENHLVKHHENDFAETVNMGCLWSNEEPVRITEAFQRDLESGRQGKLGHFFKPKSTGNLKPAKRTSPKAKVLDSLQNAVKKPLRDQQQSLILLEEVDILFQQDKDFWITVLKLVATSKRPFIMTCNNEDLVPLQAMSLHAILRLTPPPPELATDYLLLLAAREGHLISHSTVSSLYEAKGYDLRATITELDFWCQMGVGDPRGGLSWIYQRWPPGSDVDEHGRKLRVASRGTYECGMGCPDETAIDEESEIMCAWRELRIEPAENLGWYNKESIGRGIRRVYKESSESTATNLRRLDLRRFAGVAESYSASDVFCKLGLPDVASLDATQPSMTDKTRWQYIEGLSLLQAEERGDYSAMSMKLAIAYAISATTAYDHQPLSSTVVTQRQVVAPRDGLPRKRSTDPTSLTRKSFSCFDPLSYIPTAALSTGSGLDVSAFDGPLTSIATDIAPYVRSIVQYDLALEEQRARLSSVMSNGHSREKKRARTTRAARSALEGSQRASTRRERWFNKMLDLQGVLATGGEEWPKTTLGVLSAESRDGTEASGTDASMPSA